MFKAKSLMAATILIWAAGEMSSSFSPPPPPQNPFSFSFKAINNLQSVIVSHPYCPEWQHWECEQSHLEALLCVLTGVLTATPRAGRLAELFNTGTERSTHGPTRSISSSWQQLWQQHCLTGKTDRRWWGGIHLQKPVDKNASIFLLTIDVANNNPKFCSRHWFTK